MLGKKVRDKVTGFEGVVTGRVEYLTGCAQVLVQPRVKGDGEFIESRWLDEPRAEVVDEQPVMANPTPDNGPDKPAPRK